MWSEVRLIFISRVASENSRQQSFEGPCMPRCGWNSTEGGLTKQTHTRYRKTLFKVNWPSNETVRGQGARTGEAHFFPLHPAHLPALSAHVSVFGITPLCALETGGLLKQPDQVELSYCKCSPSGVSHFQGPQEHMRHSCETGRNKEWVGIWNRFSILCTSHLGLEFNSIKKKNLEPVLNYFIKVVWNSLSNLFSFYFFSMSQFSSLLGVCYYVVHVQ